MAKKGGRGKTTTKKPGIKAGTSSKNIKGPQASKGPYK